MLAYFDIENLSSFAESSAKAQFADCNRMLRGHFDLHFNFTREQLEEETKRNPAIQSWITTMTQGVKGSISYIKDEQYPPRPLKSNTHKSFNREHLSAVYLINDPRIAAFKANGCILYGGVGEEVDVLSTLFKDDDYQFQKTLEIRKMTGWDILNPFVMPATDIIIVDQYCLSDDSIYEYNIYKLIEVLSQKIRNSSVNIIIFTLPESHNRISNIDFIPAWAEIRAVIKRKVKAITGQDPKVTFVLSRTLEEHDRTIFTNYQYLVSGDTINLFDSGWNVISKGRHLGVYSLAHQDHLQAMKSFLDDMQKAIDKTKGLNPDSIKFDKESLFLNF